MYIYVYQTGKTSETDKVCTREPSITTNKNPLSLQLAIFLSNLHTISYKYTFYSYISSKETGSGEHDSKLIDFKFSHSCFWRVL